MAVVSTNVATKEESSAETSLVPPPVNLDWKSSDYISALAHLESLQKQLCKVRLGPRHVAFSLADPKETPASTFLQYQEVSEQAIHDIDNLKAAWIDPETTKLFARYKDLEHKYRLESGFTGTVGLSTAELSSGVKIPLFGWIEHKKQLLKEENLQKSGASTGKTTESMKPEEEQAVLDSFKDKFTKLEWETSSRDVLLASLRCTGCMLNFRITREQASSASYGMVYVAQVLGTGKELREIAKSIASRGRLDILKHLLEYILSFQNWKLDKCSICNQLIDKSGSYALARKESQASEIFESHFASVHNGCIG